MADMFEEARHVIEDDIRAGRYAALICQSTSHRKRISKYTAIHTNPPHQKE
jgi:hypothetical protein